MDSDPSSTTVHAYSGEVPNQVQPPNKGSPLEEGEKREREMRETCLKSICINEKRAPYPSLYRPRRGATLPSTSGVGLIPREGGFGAALGGWAPFMAPWPM